MLFTPGIGLNQGVNRTKLFHSLATDEPPLGTARSSGGTHLKRGWLTLGRGSESLGRYAIASGQASWVGSLQPWE